MTARHARARVWTLCLAALVRAALTDPPRRPPHSASSCLRTRPNRYGRRPRPCPRRCLRGPGGPAHRRRPARRPASLDRPAVARWRSDGVALCLTSTRIAGGDI